MSRDFTLMPNVETEQRVGIWTPKFVGEQKVYERDIKYRDEFYLWASNNRIPPKSDRKRIVFLGESVARGYFYDPFLTPSLTLQNILNKSRGGDFYEVVDLARTDANLELLRSITISSIDLEPDALVIFAGNNWLSDLNSSLTNHDFDLILNALNSSDKYFSLKTVLDKRFKKIVKAFIEEIHLLSTAHGVPVFFVLPEFNLLDWKSSRNEKILTWSKSNSHIFFETECELNVALNNEDIDKANELALRLTKINPFNPLGYEMLAECDLKRGQTTQALKHYELAMDTAMFRRINKPRMFTVIRETIIEEAEQYKIQFIDLAKIFREGSNLPNKDYFLDYCHLSHKGIEVSMRATANALLKYFGADLIALENIKSEEIANEIIAKAHFGAAIHCAHYGQPFEILYHHCLTALKASSIVINPMKDYIDLATHNSPWVINKAQERLEESGVMDQYDCGAGLVQPDECKIMDFVLVDAMVSALKQFDIDIEEKVVSLREKEHGVLYRKINLLDSYYHLSTYEGLQFQGRENLGYFQSLDISVNFFLVSSIDLTIDLTFTFRTPHAREVDDVVIKVNNRFALSTKASKKWKTIPIKLTPAYFNRGINIITIIWPDAQVNDINNSAVEASVMVIDSMYSIHGEIHCLEATASRSN